jgi:4-alpha-glucanotransferase
VTAIRLPVLDRRRCGVLLHPTSLLGGSQAGALGEPAFAFIDWLAEAGFTVWQMLPLGPTGTEGSPYWARSDHAGNPRLIDPSREPEGGQGAFEAYCRAQAHWLDDYALFEALAIANDGSPWWDWPEPLRDRDPQALEQARMLLAAQCHRVKREQWLFDDQWRRLRAHAQWRGIRLFGDLPIYVAPDSVSVWAQRDQFQLDDRGRPHSVSGVPPDYFAADGQLWGNPLYDWDRMRHDGFAYWRQRIGGQLERFDLLRIDHFRGLAAYWSVPAGEATARYGEWRNAAGREMLEAVVREFPDLPVVAEDLGVITPDVEALRRDFGMPGMRVLQFAFGGGADNPHLPHNHGLDTVVYTGTHDNDTTVGWYSQLDEGARRHLADYLGLWDDDGPDALTRATLGSVGRLAVLPMQDILRLGTDARLNMPGTVNGNWIWRMSLDCLTPGLAAQYRDLNALYGRLAT